MKKSELQEIADKLADIYSGDRHFEITSAVKDGNYWNLTVTAITDTEAKKDEGADDESDK